MVHLLEMKEEMLLEFIKEKILLMSSLLVPPGPNPKRKMRAEIYCIQRRIQRQALERADSTPRKRHKVVSWLGSRLVRANAKWGRGVWSYALVVPVRPPAWLRLGKVKVP